MRQVLNTWVLLVCACGGQVDAQSSPAPEGGAGSGPECVPSLGAKAAEHACQHGALGPFIQLIALVSSNAAQDMSQVHRTYAVVMEQAKPPYRGFASFRSARMGRSAFMHAAGVSVQVWDGPLRVPAIEAKVEGCAQFSNASVVSLQEGRDYVVQLASSSAREFELFVEHLEAFGAKAWAERCEN